jgi:RNA polymerase sigma-70 factor (ECF subfamily)
MDASDAAAVLARARQGDGDAFRVLVERHSHRAFQLAFRMIGNEQDAEDVVQESFLRAYRQLGRFEARANFGTWLHRIVANCAVDLLRTRQAKQQRLSDPIDQAAPLAAAMPGPGRLAESGEVRARVESAIAGLTALERAAFALRHHEGRSIAEIGRTLGLGTSASKHAVFRAVKKLRVALAPFAGRVRQVGP